jgi:hypothetical protein
MLQTCCLQSHSDPFMPLTQNSNQSIPLHVNVKMQEILNKGVFLLFYVLKGGTVRLDWICMRVVWYHWKAL